MSQDIWLPDLYNDRVFTTAEIGRGTYWDPSTKLVVYNPPAEKLVVGRYCSIAADVTIMTGGEHQTGLVSTWPFDNFIDGRPNPTRSYRVKPDTTLGSDIWLGRSGFIGGGAQVGHGAVIGAGAVVMRDIEPYAVVVGNPGNVIRLRFTETIVERLLKIAWWDWPAQEVIDRRELFYEPVEAFVERFG
ncbi:MAG TPA: CatB-related O-acetyltransferase [Caulobacteraceae bacterium]